GASLRHEAIGQHAPAIVNADFRKEARLRIALARGKKRELLDQLRWRDPGLATGNRHGIAERAFEGEPECGCAIEGTHLLAPDAELLFRLSSHLLAGRRGLFRRAVKHAHHALGG